MNINISYSLSNCDFEDELGIACKITTVQLYGIEIETKHQLFLVESRLGTLVESLGIPC
jgi:hypothetical protein